MIWGTPTLVFKRTPPFFSAPRHRASCGGFGLLPALTFPTFVASPDDWFRNSPFAPLNPSRTWHRLRHAACCPAWLWCPVIITRPTFSFALTCRGDRHGHCKGPQMFVVSVNPGNMIAGSKFNLFLSHAQQIMVCQTNSLHLGRKVILLNQLVKAHVLPEIHLTYP